MIEFNQQSLFDYTSLESDIADRLKQNAQETRTLLKRTSDDIIQIGRNLLEAKKTLGHGKFIPWVIQEIGISQKTSWRFMQIAQGKSVKMTDLPVISPVEQIEGETGLRPSRTNEEKRQSVLEFFAEFPHLHALSNREIAKRCGVTEHLVRNIRKELLDRCEDELERHGGISLAEREEYQAKAELFAQLEREREEEMEQDRIERTGGKLIEVEYEGEMPPPSPEMVEAVQKLDEMLSPKKKEPEPAGTPMPTLLLPKLSKIETPIEVQIERDIRRQQQQERNEELKEKGVDLPQNTYACLVVDPPWQMEKIERDERPNQFAFDYPTMTEDELKCFPLPAVAADDCHLYLWTTQKHLPLALRLAEHWGFKYQCLLTWVKNVGFTPFSWMYSTEHVLFCTKGNLPLLSIGRRLDFSAKVREHSRKPDEFYEIVRDVSPGPRLDIFSREKRAGFEQYGNEVEKFAVQAR